MNLFSRPLFYRPRHRRRRQNKPWAGAGLALLLTTVGIAASTTYGVAPSSASAVTSSAQPGSNDAPPPTVAPSSFLAPLPAFVRVPSIGATSALVRLGLNPDKTLEVPADFATAGWFQHGPVPGEPGPAVIAGHLDSFKGPAVFAKLREVKPGDLIEVTRADGRVVRFAVDRIDQYPKDYFPTDQVYGDTDRPELRLITCGGSFDRRAGSYRDNIVVYASLLEEPTRRAVA